MIMSSINEGNNKCHMKKILIIHPFLPYPLESGGHQALFNGILAIKDDMDVTLVYEAIDDEKHKLAQKAFLQRMPNVKLIPLLHQPTPQYIPTKEELIRGKVRNLYRRIFRIKDAPVVVPPKDITNIWKFSVTPNNKKWAEHIYNVSHAEHYDIIQIEMPWRISDIYAMPKDSKVVFVHHELGFVRREQELQNEGNCTYLQICKRFVDLNELAQLNMYDAVVTLSEIDKAKLINTGVKAPVYSSFAVVNYENTDESRTRDTKRLVFIGPEGHPPNLFGLTWFLDNCWGKLKEKDSDYRLDIIGKWSLNKRNEIANKYSNVNFLGFVDNLHEVINGGIMIVPITIGSGIRMKILEACYSGVPFVSTSVGAEGIPVVHGEHCFLADKPEDFVNSIVKLQDSHIYDRFQISARDLVTNNFSIHTLRENRMNIYRSILERKESGL